MLSWFKKSYKHLNKISISKSNLIYNFHTIQNHNPQGLISPVLKANAYGHGLKLVAPIFDKLNPPFLCVDSLFEAWQLEKLGVRSNILVLGFTLPENLKNKAITFHLPLFDLETANILNRYQKNAKVHLKIDTGMNRFGIKVTDLTKFIEQLVKYTNLKIEGIYTHLSCADDPKNPSNQAQIHAFKQALEILASYGINPYWKHIAASAASIYMQDSCFNLIRVGLANFGIYPLDKASDQFKLKPVLQMRSKICQIKNIHKGETISYGNTFKAKSDMTIGVIGAGYYEGIDRRLSNLGFVKVDGIPCQILGRVCMNISMIDLSQIINPYVGQECLVYSDNPTDPNSLENSAKLCQTIPYDLLGKLNETVKREVVE